VDAAILTTARPVGILLRRGNHWLAHNVPIDASTWTTSPTTVRFSSVCARCSTARARLPHRPALEHRIFDWAGNQYTEFFPYVNRLWFGEGFNYDAMSPEQWLVECSGIPFGLMGDMLEGAATAGAGCSSA